MRIMKILFSIKSQNTFKVALMFANFEMAKFSDFVKLYCFEKTINRHVDNRRVN